MKKFGFNIAEKMIGNIDINEKDEDLLKKIEEMLVSNIKINGNDLLIKIMRHRKLDFVDVYLCTGIDKYVLQDIYNKKRKITKRWAINLSKLGYPKECFLNK
jgi:hypothetical protein